MASSASDSQNAQIFTVIYRIPDLFVRLQLLKVNTLYLMMVLIEMFIFGVCDALRSFHRLLKRGT